MNTHAKKTPERERQSAASAAARSPSGAPSRFPLSDNRPEAIAQREMQLMVDNSQTVQLASERQGSVVERSPVVQRKGINYEAGTGNLWHVHKDHVKYDGNNGSRINFAGRTKTYIKTAMERYHNTLGHDTNRHHTYMQCRKWINEKL
jgi:hypothetical protein